MTSRLARALIAVAIGLMIAPTADAQILNTLRGWSSDEPGWSGKLGASFAASGGNTDVVSVAASARAQWLGGRQRVRALVGGTRTESDGRKSSESLVGHVRHNVEIVSWFSTLVFAQVQENPFQRLESRVLLGAGGRFDVARHETWALSVGVAHMFETERLDGESGRRDDHRLSSFASAEGDLSESVTIDATAFYQPRWSDFADSRLVASGSLSVALVGSLSLEVAAAVQVDTRPPDGVERRDWSQVTGLSVSF